MSTNHKQEFSFESIIQRVMLIEGIDKPADIARALGVSSSLFSNWKKRGTMPFQQLLSYASKKELSYEWLMKGVGSRIASAGKITNKETGISEVFEQTPYLDVVSAINGEIKADNSGDYVLVSKRVIREEGLNINNIYAIKPYPQDALIPTVRNNADLLVDITDVEIHDGKIYAFHDHRTMYTRRLQLTVGGGLTVRADNQHIQDMELTEEKANQLVIVGRIFGEAVFNKL